MTVPLEAINADTTLLTVNKRLASELRTRFDALQQGTGRRVWDSADIVPWEAWLVRLYVALVDTGQADYDLLDTTQESLLWQSVIERDPDNTNLLRRDAAARVAQASARLIADWQLERHPLATLGGEQTRTLLAWKATLERELAQRRQLSRAQLLPELTRALAAGRLPLPGGLVMAGFDDLSPAQQALLDTLTAAGCHVDTLADPAAGATCTRVRASDSEAEIRMAARWADHVTRTDSTLRVAIVTPQIAPLRADIERVLTATLAPARYLQQGEPPARFNVSLGTPLADCPLVDTALRLLETLRGEHPLHGFGQLLRSAFVGGHDDEWAARALLDAALRDDGMPLVDLRRVRFRLGQYAPGDQRHCPRLARSLDAAIARLDTLPRRASPAAWAGHLQHLLRDFGWPGDRPLDSTEYQQRERFRRLFSELAALAKVRPSLRLDEAVRLLRGLARDALFQPESAPAPIQVLGPLEAAGMRFDAIWLLGMHDREWPPAPRPDPLLPPSLQRELGMPHASAERELAFAAALTGRLVHACETLIASHPAADGDRELRPSPLIADWPATDALQVFDRKMTPAHEVCRQHDGLQTTTTGALPPPAATLAGGAGLLASQAACPFQAAARYRLRADPLAEPAFAADAALTGSLVHELLQRVWQILGDSAGLARYTGTRLDDLVLPLARATLDDIGQRRPDIFTPRFRDLEARRLTGLVSNWLEVERTRRQPFRVVALEKKQDVGLAGLTLSTRVDRIDELDDGSLAVIDYKTGRTVTSSGWFDERLSEPQLPLYCVQADAPVGAALLARVRSDTTGCRFVGVSREAGFAAGVEPAGDDSAADWARTLTHWRNALGSLTAEVVAGRADPTPSPAACRYCPLGALCRVGDPSVEAGDDD